MSMDTKLRVPPRSSDARSSGKDVFSSEFSRPGGSSAYRDNNDALLSNNRSIPSEFNGMDGIPVFSRQGSEFRGSDIILRSPQPMGRDPARISPVPGGPAEAAKLMEINAYRKNSMDRFPPSAKRDAQHQRMRGVPTTPVPQMENIRRDEISSAMLEESGRSKSSTGPHLTSNTAAQSYKNIYSRSPHGIPALNSNHLYKREQTGPSNHDGRILQDQAPSEISIPAIQASRGGAVSSSNTGKPQQRTGNLLSNSFGTTHAAQDLRRSDAVDVPSMDPIPRPDPKTQDRFLRSSGAMASPRSQRSGKNTDFACREAPGETSTRNTSPRSILRSTSQEPRGGYLPKLKSNEPQDITLATVDGDHSPSDPNFVPGRSVRDRTMSNGGLPSDRDQLSHRGGNPVDKAASKRSSNPTDTETSRRGKSPHRTRSRTRGSSPVDRGSLSPQSVGRNGYLNDSSMGVTVWSPSERAVPRNEDLRDRAFTATVVTGSSPRDRMLSRHDDLHERALTGTASFRDEFSPSRGSKYLDHQTPLIDRALTGTASIRDEFSPSRGSKYLDHQTPLIDRALTGTARIRDEFSPSRGSKYLDHLHSTYEERAVAGGASARDDLSPGFFQASHSSHEAKHLDYHHTSPTTLGIGYREEPAPYKSRYGGNIGKGKAQDEKPAKIRNGEKKSARSGARAADEDVNERINYLEKVLEDTCRESKESLQRAHQSIQNLTKALQEKEDQLGQVKDHDRVMTEKETKAENELHNIRSRVSNLEFEKIDREAELGIAKEELEVTKTRLNFLEEEKVELQNKVSYLTLQEASSPRKGMNKKLETANAQARAAWESAAGWRARSQAIEEEKSRAQQILRKYEQDFANNEISVRKAEHTLKELGGVETVRQDLLQAIDLVEKFINTGNPHILDPIFLS